MKQILGIYAITGQAICRAVKHREAWAHYRLESGIKHCLAIGLFQGSYPYGRSGDDFVRVCVWIYHSAMSAPKIQLLVFERCPLAPAARSALQRAIEIVGFHEFEEIDILDPDTPEDLRGWGSPTILINGRDVTGASKGDGVGCRIYTSPDEAPDVTTIANVLRAAKLESP